MKKTVSVILTSVMLFSQGVFVKAEDSMEDVLISVKEKVDIPDALTEFDTTTSTGRSEGYSFNWSNEDGSINISVSCDLYGNIKSYSHYNQEWYSNNSNFKIREDFNIDEPKKLADDTIKKYVPTLFSSELDYLSPLPYNGRYSISNPSTYTFEYERIYDGVKVKDNYASVSVIYANDTYTVQNVHISWDYQTEFENLENIIAPDEAKAIYTEKYPLRLEYRKTYKGDYLLEYIHDEIHYIDAKASDEVKEDEKEDYPFLKAENSAADSASGGGSSSRLSPAEIKELANLENLMSVEELTEILTSIPEFAFSGDNLSSYSYKQEDEYFTSISTNNNDFSSHASLNAENGEIISYYKYSRDYDGKETFSKEKADAFLKKYYSDEVNSSQKKNNTNSVSYTRLVHDIPYVSNYINASWSEKTDSIDNFYRKWDKDISKIPAPDKILDKEKAYETILAHHPLTLQYIMVGGMFKPVYTIFDSSIRLDAFSGDFLNYSGAKADDEKIEYDDIDGHWCENIAKTLADYGIGIDNSSLAPDNEITQSGFLKLVYTGILGRYPSDDITAMYKRLENLNILSSAEMNSDAPITRETAIRYLLRAMGITEVAEIKGIYICDFADSMDISSDKFGYCAIAKGFGLVNGSDGKLYPKNNITNAEALAMIYNYLTR